MTGWNDVIPDEHRLPPLAWLNMLIDAINERRKVRFSSPTLLEHVSEGDNIQEASFWDLIQSFLPSMIGASFWVFADAYDAGSYDAASGSPDWANHVTIRARLGLTGDSYRRRRPREIADAEAMEDEQGNVAAAGQRAWNLASHELYEHDGEAWAPAAATASPDILDSELPAPSHVPHGLIQTGDYIGLWLMRELRDYLNLMVVGTSHSTSGFFGAFDVETVDKEIRQVQATGSGADSWESLIADAESDWEAASWSSASSGDPGIRRVNRLLRSSTGSARRAMISTTRSLGRATTPNPFARKIAFVNTGNDPAGPTSFGRTLESSEFHPQRVDAAVAGKRFIFAESPITSDEVVDGALYEDRITEAWPDPPVNNDHFTLKGHGTNWTILMRWDVAGGFQFTAET